MLGETELRGFSSGTKCLPAQQVSFEVSKRMEDTGAESDESGTRIASVPYRQASQPSCVYTASVLRGRDKEAQVF